MAKCDKAQTRLGCLLKRQGLLINSELSAALASQKRSGENLGTILVSHGAISRHDLARTLTLQRMMRLASLAGSLMLAPMAAWSDSNYNQTESFSLSHYDIPTTDRPPIYEGDPISVPVKALVERLAFGVKASSYEVRKFRYDIDTLGQGMALRLQMKF